MSFFNRSFRVKLVKDKDPITDSKPIDYDAVSTVIVKKVAAVIVVYIGADTLRHVILHAVKAKI